ncbi:MAG: type transport system ATP-binding protein [Acidobacteriota bacterium]|jgi:ABC-2 type transport system ATP-binding protein|nr:type transport system ATP-binding protein [Acidobacteriota bacterium]
MKDEGCGMKVKQFSIHFIPHPSLRLTRRRPCAYKGDMGENLQGGAAAVAIETFDLVRRFGDFTAVDGIDLRVGRGAFFGFLGPNGAGKSTTIKMLTGLLAPTSGRMRVLGRDIAVEPLEVKRRIGVVPEDLNLFERLTGAEMLAFTGRMYGLGRADITSRTRELLELMELDEEPRRLIVEYSHGMKKKLALACALLHRPEILFLDEPFEGVDAVASRTLKDLLSRLTARGLTVFLTSHVLEIVERLCTDIAIISGGRLVAAGPLEELRRGISVGEGERGEALSLEDYFISVVGGTHDAGADALQWLG